MDAAAADVALILRPELNLNKKLKFISLDRPGTRIFRGLWRFKAISSPAGYYYSVGGGACCSLRMSRFWCIGWMVRWKTSYERDSFRERRMQKCGMVLTRVGRDILTSQCRGSPSVEIARLLRRSNLYVRGLWPMILCIMCFLKEQGFVLSAFLGLSAIFSMAETSIATLWPSKVHELSDEEPEGGVFTMLHKDIARFLTTILVGTTMVNVGAAALVAEATMGISDAGVTMIAGSVIVVVLLITEIIPRNVTVLVPMEIMKAVVRPIAWLSFIIYPVGRAFISLSMRILLILGLHSKREPYVTQEEMKLIVGGTEVRPVEEEEQDMIENVLEIKDTDVKEVMTPLIDVVAIEARATLIEFHKLLATHHYSRVPVYEDRIDNIMGIAYATDVLEYMEVGQLESCTVLDIARKPAYFVIETMPVSILLREFRIRVSHMAVVLNEHGGMIGVATFEDIVEEIIGEVFDESDSKERIQKRTGFILMRSEGVYDVGANTSIDEFSEKLNVKLPKDHEYETVSGFICDAFGYIPRIGESTDVVLEICENEFTGWEDQQECHRTFRVQVLSGNRRKVNAVRFERIIDHMETKTGEKTTLVCGFLKDGGNGTDGVMVPTN